VLIDSLDGDGYLADPLEEIAERLAEMLDISEPRRARNWTTACAARCAGCRAWSPSACRRALAVGMPVLLQLRTANPPGAPVAMAICEKHLELLARRDMQALVAPPAPTRT
jgi:RNA polymerase sigma-54 factor